jgi:hypothetical protein
MTTRTLGDSARRFSFVGAILGAALLSVACRSESVEARRGEAGGVARAVEALRQAPNAGKAPFLKALQSAPCHAEDVCAVKTACVDAYVLEEAARSALSAVRARTRTADGLTADAVDLLANAEHDLGRSRELTKACADLEAAARRKYGL